MATPMPINTTIAPEDKKILAALEKEPQSTNDLIFQTGLSGPEIAKTIHGLKGYGYVVTQDVDSGNMSGKRTKHFITPAGRNLWYQISPRKFDKKNNGYKHVHGVVGKIDYSKPLTGMNAKVYEVLVRPKMTADEITNACNLADPQPVWNTLTRLLELDIVEYVEERSKATGRMCRHYTRKRDMRIQGEEEPVSPPPKPRLTACDPGNPIIQSVLQQVTPPPATEAPKTVEAAIDELLQQYPMDEVVIALNVKLVDVYQSYQDLTRRFLNAAVNAGHTPRK